MRKIPPDSSPLARYARLRTVTFMASIRVATWNLDLNTDTRPARARAAATALRGVDVALIQEAYPEALAEITAETGLKIVSISDDSARAVLTHLPTVAASTLDTVSALANARSDTLTNSLLRSSQFLAASQFPYATLRLPSGRLATFYSAHLAWGNPSEGARLTQAHLIDDHAASVHQGVIDSGFITDEDRPQAHHTAVLGMDANTLPNSATIRYLTGLEPAPDLSSTTWVDTYAKTLPDWPCEHDGCSSCPVNSRAAATASIVGIENPELLPHRRIDYLMVRGYAHGRPLCPLASEPLGFATPEPSDHYGLVATLLDPPL